MDSALGVDRSTCIVAVGCANRFLYSVFIEATGNVVARCAIIGKTRFVNAAPALPSRDLGTIVCVRATVIHIVGLALICKDVLARLAFDFWWGKEDTIADVGIARRIRIARLFENPIARFTFRKCVFVAFPSSISASGVALWVARASLIVALRIVATRFELVPFPCHAFRKRVIVAFPSAVGAWRRVGRIQGLVFWRDRVGAASGEECRRSERDPIEFAMFHDAISPFIQVTRSEIYKTSLPSIIWR